MRLTATVSRRGAIAAMAGAVAQASALSDDQMQEQTKPYGWIEEAIDQRKIYVRGQGGRTVVLLHEINGMSPGCVDFGDELVAAGFKVYMPLLFGHPVQDSVPWGWTESCLSGGFKCCAAGVKKNPRPVIWVSDLVNHLCLRNEVITIGVIGMCQTGAYPLATMQKDSKVKAVVVSQPALPFGQTKQRDVGLTEDTMTRAKASGIPILAFRFKADTISTCQRFEFLKEYFGPQFDGRQKDGPPGFHQTTSHRLHAVLTGVFGDIREKARRETIQFLNEHL